VFGAIRALFAVNHRVGLARSGSHSSLIEFSIATLEIKVRCWNFNFYSGFAASMLPSPSSSSATSTTVDGGRVCVRVGDSQVSNGAFYSFERDGCGVDGVIASVGALLVAVLILLCGRWWSGGSRSLGR